ncbi:hypothetical protein NEF87_000560 [Candidatus Lokiarchaeum ossiferum]|uniref:Zinc-ribbon domain-containing protein n=1 Tax=Candidatus Lokiarchaeum ossiferum TaxID=2951803 RepID=A0ABY6HL97_9ARCH|nr:hypothetical protein NEF87_000560 [Candidatus Lokiarchaeum sp. B-35]
MQNHAYSSNQFNSNIFFEFGNSMKNYVKASVIVAIIGIIGSFIIPFLGIIPMLYGSGSSGPYQTMGGMMLISSLFGLASLGLSIFVLVRYIQYLSALKRIGQTLNDFNLQKAYKMEIGTIIGSIIFPIILIATFVPVIISMVNDPYEAMITGFLGLILLALLGGTIIFVLSILGVIALDRWGEQFRYNNNLIGINIAEGINYMKWGRIIAPFTGGIGSIFYLVGMWKAGTNLMIYKAGENQPGTFQPSMPSYQRSSETNFDSFSEQTYRPDSTLGGNTIIPSGFCSKCGQKILNLNSTFCENCGNKLK